MGTCGRVYRARRETRGVHGVLTPRQEVQDARLVRLLSSCFSTDDLEATGRFWIGSSAKYSPNKHASERMQVFEVTHFSFEVADAVRRLLPQLGSSASPPSDELIKKIIDSDASRLLLASAADSVLGMLTIVIFPLPSGTRAWIEDVVVDTAGRGKGVGQALNEEALALARREGARTVDLTSRPSRAAANRLYKRIGFVPRETNIYRFQISGR